MRKELDETTQQTIVGIVFLLFMFVIGSILWTKSENEFDHRQNQYALYDDIRNWQEERDPNLAMYQYIGDTKTKRYYPISSPETLNIHADRLIGFDDIEAAEDAGYKKYLPFDSWLEQGEFVVLNFNQTI